jgi:hypothetical protein
MSQEVPFRHQRNALEPRHVLGIRQCWLKLAKRHHDKLEFHLAAYYVNLLFAILAGVSFGFRATEVCPGQLFFLRRALTNSVQAGSNFIGLKGVSRRVSWLNNCRGAISVTL